MDILVPSDEDRSLSEDDLAHHVSRELSQAYGLKESDIKSARYKGMRYYYGEFPRRPEKPRSGLRSTDIADVCDALMAEIVPMFTASGELCQFEAQNPQDKFQAQQESKAVNYLFFEYCNGAQVIHDLLMDGLLQRNATAQVEVIEDLKTDVRTAGPFTEMELAMGMQQHLATSPDESLEVVGGDEHEDGRATVTLRRKWVEKKLCVHVHPPENVYVCTDHDSLCLDDARFVAFRVTPTRSDLVELGIDYDTAYNQIPKWSQQRDYDAIARDRMTDESNIHASHKSGEQVECYRCFYWIDADGDGIAELHEILFSKPKIILADEIVGYSNLAGFSPWPVPHNWVGTGLVDKLEELVKAKTTFLRQTVDNMIRTNNQRLICKQGSVDPGSVSGADPLAPIWVSDPAAVVPLSFPNNGQIGYQMLDYLDKMRRERVGSTLDVQSKGAQSQMVPGDTAHGVERMMTVLEKQAAQIANNLADTLKYIFRCMHKLLRESDYGRIVYQTDGQMAAQNPQLWPERTRVCVKLGLSEGRRMQKLGALEATFQKQMQLMQAAPGVLVSNQQIYETLTEQAVIAGLDVPQRFWIDPNSPQAQQVMQQQQQQQMAMAQAQQQAQERAMQVQELIAQNEQLKAQLKAANDARKQRLDEIEAIDESARAWTDLEIQANKDLGPEGRYQ